MIRMPFNSSRARSGFTLVELSIVLVIIGLLLGGVLIGKDMIESAKLRKMIADVESYRAATAVFEEKYNALPGDMSNATQFWGTDAACPNSATTGTCNGNGNAQITNGVPGEPSFVWQHLARAGLIKGNYMPNWTDGTITPGLDAAPTPYPGTLISMFYIGVQSGAAAHYDGSYDNVLYAGGTTYTVPGWFTGGFSCDRITMIDQKMDDGKPAVGNVVLYSRLSGCTSNTAANAGLSADYVPNGSGLSVIVFKLGRISS